MRLFLSIFFGMIVVLSLKPMIQELQAAQRRGGRSGGCANGVCGLPQGRLVTQTASMSTPSFQLVPVQPAPQAAQPTLATPPIPVPRVPPPKPTSSVSNDSDDLLLAQATTTQAPTKARPVDQETRNSVSQLSTATQQPTQTFQLVSMPTQQQFQQPIQLVSTGSSRGGCSGGSCGGGGRRGLFGRKR